MSCVNRSLLVGPYYRLVMFVLFGSLDSLMSTIGELVADDGKALKVEVGYPNDSIKMQRLMTALMDVRDGMKPPKYYRDDAIFTLLSECVNKTRDLKFKSPTNPAHICNPASIGQQWVALEAMRGGQIIRLCQLLAEQIISNNTRLATLDAPDRIAPVHGLLFLCTNNRVSALLAQFDEMYTMIATMLDCELWHHATAYKELKVTPPTQAHKAVFNSGQAEWHLLLSLFTQMLLFNRLWRDRLVDSGRFCYWTESGMYDEMSTSLMPELSKDILSLPSEGDREHRFATVFCGATSERFDLKCINESICRKLCNSLDKCTSPRARANR
jgi:hypothetical protein